VSLSLATPAPAAATEYYPALFGTDEQQHDGVGPFKKWATVVDRYRQEAVRGAEPCESGIVKSCDVKDWRAFLGSLAGRDIATQLAAVNDFINNHSYRTDPVNWRVEDYWAIPSEFLTRDGDC